jgi:ferric-dicitrate binding protein FerR (iron transport regulator)
MTEQRDDRVDESMLGDLLKSVGRGPALSTEARERIYRNVHARWSTAVGAASPRSGVSDLASRPRRRRTARWVALAATLAGIAVLVFQLRAPSLVPGAAFASVLNVQGRAAIERDGRSLGIDAAGPEIRVGDRLVTERGGRLGLALATGQILRLDSSTNLEVADLARLDLTVGTVYFDSLGRVAPLTVATALGAVAHVGTQYEASFSAARLRVRVREGAATIGAGGGRAIEATAGEQLQISAEGDISRAAFATDDPVWQWAESLAIAAPADEHNLIEILEWVSRESGVELRFDDPATEARARAVSVTGLTGFNPREALEAISTTTEFTYRLGNGQLFVAATNR